MHAKQNTKAWKNIKNLNWLLKKSLQIEQIIILKIIYLFKRFNEVQYDIACKKYFHHGH